MDTFSSHWCEQIFDLEQNARFQPKNSVLRKTLWFLPIQINSFVESIRNNSCTVHLNIILFFFLFIAHFALISHQWKKIQDWIECLFLYFEFIWCESWIALNSKLTIESQMLYPFFLRVKWMPAYVISNELIAFYLSSTQSVQRNQRFQYSLFN